MIEPLIAGVGSTGMCSMALAKASLLNRLARALLEHWASRAAQRPGVVKIECRVASWTN
jgi:hypothetical protein